jgi:hypothetical protein
LPAGNWKWGGSSIRGEYSDVKTDGWWMSKSVNVCIILQ